MRLLLFLFCSSLFDTAGAQANFSFDFSNNGQRVCLVDVAVSLAPPSVTIHFLDAAANTTQTTNVYRRHLYGSGADWVLVASGLAAGTTNWTDNAVAYGEVWEYQVKRIHGAGFSTGYTAAAVGYDQSNYRGRMILLTADNIATGLPSRYAELKKDLTGDGWQVQEIIVPVAYGWDSGDTVVGIRLQIQSLYNAAPANDKPKQLFILGHVPLPRAGLGGQTPDAHIQNAGARGADTYYADVDGVFTDVSTYNPGGLSTPYAVNLPGDFKWDQDIIPSALEMGFGRIDFADISSYAQSELTMTDQYLLRLHHYRQADAGFNMGNKTAFFLGYDNSNDGSYRSLPPISGGNNVYQNTTALPHPQWVQQNGPFMMYMQNVTAPQIGQWNTYGMNAAIYSSDQSYWGFGDVPEGNQYSTIRAILCADTKCVMAIWTTMAINIFHQAGVGETMGAACKQIMDHNTTNQKLEKPSSAFDTPAFWNRTQFELYGDPTIRLYQVLPATSPQLTAGANNSIVLQWTASADNNIVGYAVYKSATALGKFDKISGSAPIAATGFTDTDPHPGEWYMIRAVKQQTTGSGIFFNPAQGIFIQNTITVLPVSLNEFTAVKEKQAALLQWSTSSETANTGFAIERSADAVQWSDIATVNSLAMNGNSNSILSYSYSDEHPLIGNNYYRLKFLPAYGIAQQSNTRKLYFEKMRAISFSPNPVTDMLRINTGGDAIVSIRLLDEQGRLLYEDRSGSDLVKMKAYPGGIYFLEILLASGEKFKEKILK